MAMSRTEEHGALPFRESEHRASRTDELVILGTTPQLLSNQSIAVKLGRDVSEYSEFASHGVVVVLIYGYTPKNDLIITVINCRSFLAERPLSAWSRLPFLILVHDSQSLNQIYHWSLVCNRGDVSLNVLNHGPITLSLSRRTMMPSPPEYIVNCK